MTNIPRTSPVTSGTAGAGANSAVAIPDGTAAQPTLKSVLDGKSSLPTSANLGTAGTTPAVSSGPSTAGQVLNTAATAATNSAVQSMTQEAVQDVATKAVGNVAGKAAGEAIVGTAAGAVGYAQDGAAIYQGYKKDGKLGAAEAASEVTAEHAAYAAGSMVGGTAGGIAAQAATDAAITAGKTYVAPPLATLENNINQKYGITATARQTKAEEQLNLRLDAELRQRDPARWQKLHQDNPDLPKAGPDVIPAEGQ